jgi:hypothetical protein
MTKRGDRQSIPPTDATQQVRACWRALDDLASRAGRDADGGERAHADLVTAHHAALDALVSAGALEAEVADQVQATYVEAAYHIWRVSAPMTCYIALPPEYWPRENLVAQASALNDAQRAGDLDPEAVAEARAALERDVALFAAAGGGEGTSLGQELLATWHTGEIEVDARARDAARFLVDLLR